MLQTQLLTDEKQKLYIMTSITFLILSDKHDADNIVAHLGAHLLEDFGLSEEEIRCISLNENDILKNISAKSTNEIVRVADISCSEERDLSTNPVYQSLVFLRNRYTLNKARRSMYEFEKKLAADIMMALTTPNKTQDEKALLNAITIIGPSQDVYEYIAQAKVFKPYIVTIKKMYDFYSNIL